MIIKRILWVSFALVVLCINGALAEKTLNIPASVKIIEEESFFGDSSLDVVVLPEGVETIGSRAFSGSSLRKISLPASLKAIADDAFSAPGKLTVTAPQGSWTYGWALEKGYIAVEESPLEDFVIENGVVTKYVGPGGDVVIPNSVTSIGEYAFEDCDSLTSVKIPNSVTSIGDWAFNPCSSLTSIDVDPANRNYSSLNGVLFDRQKSTHIAYPGGLQGRYVTPNSVTSIGKGAFGGCGLTSVTIPGIVTSIGKQAFWSCCLTSVTIPNSVKSVGEEAFVFCDRLTSVTIDCSDIERHAFHECTSLMSVSIGDSVTSIGIGAFYMCRCLTDVTIPNSVTSIGGSAFEYCDNLTSVSIGNGVTSIGESAFGRCISLASIDVDSANQNYSSLNGVLFDRE